MIFLSCSMVYVFVYFRLVLQKNSATIEEVTDEILSELIDSHEYVVVYFTGDCEEGEKFYHILITFRDNSDVARQRSNRTFSNSIFETSLIADFFSTHITSN